MSEGLRTPVEVMSVDEIADRMNEMTKHFAEMADRIKELETRLKKAIEIADDLAYAHSEWIADIDYEEFYSWREELD